MKNSSFSLKENCLPAVLKYSMDLVYLATRCIIHQRPRFPHLNFAEGSMDLVYPRRTA